MSLIVFAGLCTIDHFYYFDGYPSENQKIRCTGYSLDAGGPCFNASITNSILGGESEFFGHIGGGNESLTIVKEAEKYGIGLINLDNEKPPATAAIGVNEKSGSRTVWSFQPNSNSIFDKNDYTINPNAKCLVVDGHQINVAIHLAKQAKIKNIPVLLDAGSWKPNLESLIKLCTCVIGSSNFKGPNGEEPFSYLEKMGVIDIAVTRNEKPIQFLESGAIHEITVPAVNAVDTLGAGDVYHGAYAYYRYIKGYDFVSSLSLSAEVASNSVLFKGARVGVSKIAETMR